MASTLAAERATGSAAPVAASTQPIAMPMASSAPVNFSIPILFNDASSRVVGYLIGRDRPVV